MRSGRRRSPGHPRKLSLASRRRSGGVQDDGGVPVGNAVYWPCRSAWRSWRREKKLPRPQVVEKGAARGLAACTTLLRRGGRQKCNWRMYHVVLLLLMPFSSGTPHNDAGLMRTIPRRGAHRQTVLLKSERPAPPGAVGGALRRRGWCVASSACATGRSGRLRIPPRPL